MKHASLREQMIYEVEVFLKKTGISKSRFGIESVGNDKILEHMRAGKCPRSNTIDAMRLYMAEKRLEHAAKKKAQREQRRELSSAA